MADSPTVRYFKPLGLSGLELLTCPDASFLFPPHFHLSYCIWHNSCGGEHYSHHGNSYILPPDSFGIIAPGEVHSNHACDKRARNLVTFYLDPGQVQVIGAQIREQGAQRAEFRTDIYHDPEALQGLVALHRVLSHSSSALERESAFLQVFALLLRRHSHTRPQDTAVGAEPGRVGRIIELFHARLSEDIGLQELAELFDCTPYFLIRFFKKAVGLSPHAYLVQLRLEKARRLLDSGSSIVEAALDTGFSDQSHLTRHFKTRFGLPPGAYLRQTRTS